MLLFLLTLADESHHSEIEKIYNEYHADMMRYAISKLSSVGVEDYVHAAEDAVQNTFLKIVKYINSVDFSRAKKQMKNYVFAILMHEIVDIYHDSEENAEFFEETYDATLTNFVEEIYIKDRYQEVVNAIAKLDEKYACVMYFVFCLDKSVDEVAEMMGISSKTVYTRLSRGKEKLRQMLKGDE